MKLTFKRILSVLALASSFLIFMGSSCKSQSEPSPEPKPDPEEPLVPTFTPLTFSVDFSPLSDVPSEAPFKTSWKEGDSIVVYAANETKSVCETMAVKSIKDGESAQIVSTGKVTNEYSLIYAYVKETGVTEFVPSTHWSVGEGITSPSRTVVVTSAAATEKSLHFKNIYSYLSFEVSKEGAAKVVLTGNDGEILDFPASISASDFSVTPLSTTSETKSLSIPVELNKPVYLSLVPGLTLPKGFTLTVLDAEGNELGKSENPAALTVGSAEVISVAEFVYPEPPAPRTDVFDANDIVLSLGVVSDVHIGTSPAVTSKWKSALQQLKNRASQSDPNGLAGVLVCGDLIDNPNDSYVSTFKSTYESVFSPKTVPMIYTVGNHDVNGYSWSSSAVSQSAPIRQVLGSSYFEADLDKEAGSKYECRYCRVGDYDILSVTPNQTSPLISYDSNVLNWLDTKLKALTEANPDRYIVVLTHPMIENTVYGSLLGTTDGIWSSSNAFYWSTSALTPILKKYPQVLAFGGHLHFPLNDPRSVWQGDFSVFGCASVRYMAIENGRFEDMKSQCVMNDADEFSQGNLLQFDRSGNMRILRMDFFHSEVIGDPLVLTYPKDDKSHLSKYTFTRRALANAAPKISTLEVETNDATTVKFASGTDDEFVHHYEIVLSKGGSVINSKRILADFYKTPKPSGMKDSWTLSLGKLSIGTYSVSLTAYDSWDAASNVITKSFTVGDVEGDVWTGDEAGSRTIEGGDGSVSASWLSYASGKVSWTANTTGKPRVGKLTLPSGRVFTLTQISVNDFKGNWKVLSSQFGGRGNYFVRNASASTPVTIGDPLSTASLEYAGKSISNNLGITGLAANLVMDVHVNIDYESHDVQMGLFFDGRKAQKILSGGLTGTYGAFLPELCAGAWANYEFGRVDIGTPDYDWLWMNVSFSNGTISAVYLPFVQRIATTHTYKRDYIIGIEVMNFTSEDATAASLVRSTSQSNTEDGSYQADWITIYQSNYGGVNTSGLTFKKD